MTGDELKQICKDAELAAKLAAPFLKLADGLSALQGNEGKLVALAQEREEKEAIAKDAIAKAEGTVAWADLQVADAQGRVKKANDGADKVMADLATRQKEAEAKLAQTNAACSLREKVAVDFIAKTTVEMVKEREGIIAKLEAERHAVANDLKNKTEARDAFVESMTRMKASA